MDRICASQEIVAVRMELLSLCIVIIFLPYPFMLGYCPLKDYLPYADTSDQIRTPVTVCNISYCMLGNKFIYHRKISSVEQTLYFHIDFSQYFHNTIVLFTYYVCMYVYSIHLTELRNI